MTLFQASNNVQSVINNLMLSGKFKSEPLQQAKSVLESTTHRLSSVNKAIAKTIKAIDEILQSESPVHELNRLQDIKDDIANIALVEFE
jgi:capsule polysaccharide export protein KpsC/LpsZ